MTRALAVLSLLLAGSALSAEKQKVAVLQFRSSPDAVPLASAVSAVVANELQRLGVFSVTTQDQVRDLISLERQKQLLGAGEEGSGMAELGSALAVQYLVSGEVNRLKNGKEEVLALQLVLLQTSDGKRVSSELVNAKSEGALVNLVGAATLKLCAKVLSGQQGTLYVAVSEAGATVKVDDSIRGTTPLAGRLELPSGPHLVVVEKQGFVTWQGEVRISPDAHTEQNISMVPSPDFIKSYEAGASRMRIGAYVATGLAVAGVAGAGYFQFRNSQLYGTPEKAGTFAYHQARLNQGEEDDRQPAQKLKAQIEQGATLTYVSAGVGAASALAAAYFFVAGDPPGRYQRYEVLSLGIAPTSGGATAALTVGF